MLVKTASRVGRFGDHGEQGDVKALVWFRVLNTLGISTWLQVCRGPVAYATWLWYTFLCVRVHAGDINDKLLTAAQAGETTVVGELELNGGGEDLKRMHFSSFWNSPEKVRGWKVRF